jgi:ribosomal protein S27AE
MSLPPFQDELVRCPKCGLYAEPDTEYRNHGCLSANKGDAAAVIDFGQDLEHLHRTCTRCGYWWDEQVTG